MFSHVLKALDPCQGLTWGDDIFIRGVLHFFLRGANLVPSGWAWGVAVPDPRLCEHRGRLPGNKVHLPGPFSAYEACLLPLLGVYSGAWVSRGGILKELP